MNCSWLAEVRGFDCRPVTGIHGDRGIEVGTPFFYADGTAIVFYVFQQNEHLLFSDNGDALFHLQCQGLDPLKAKRKSILREIVAKHGATITDAGDVRALVPEKNGRYQFAQIISGLLAIAEWEREQTGLSENVRNLADEAECYLRAWKPHASLIKRPGIVGQSKKTHHFDYLLESDFIEVVSPSHMATGAVMRKAGDVLNGPFLDDRSILVIVDDREDPAHAEIERQIVGSLVKSMSFSTLIKHAEGMSGLGKPN